MNIMNRERKRDRGKNEGEKKKKNSIIWYEVFKLKIWFSAVLVAQDFKHACFFSKRSHTIQSPFQVKRKIMYAGACAQTNPLVCATLSYSYLHKHSLSSEHLRKSESDFKRHHQLPCSSTPLSSSTAIDIALGRLNIMQLSITNENGRGRT